MNVTITFQAALTTEFRHMLDRFVLIYLDDILVYNRSLDEQVEYLGHYVTPQGIRPLADKIEALRVWPEPTNTKDVRSFMGLAGYYQRFITGYSRIAAPMTRLQSPKVPFVFDDDARRSFRALKTVMLMAPVLSIYDPTLPTRVTTDISDYGIGAVLEQHDGDDWHPVEYFSHKVSPINSLDDARKKELLAFVMALKRWQHFLLGRRRFTWVTDNNPLTYYKTQDTVLRFAMGTPMKCLNCNGDGHFARECPSARGNQSASGNSAAAPSTPRFWTPRQTAEDNEEREFLRQIVQEKKDEQTRKRELDDQRKFDERLKAEMARYAEATKAEVMAAVGRQYLGQKDEARREELKRGWSPPPRRREDFRLDDDLRDDEDIDLEIHRLELLREKRRRGKEAVRGGVNFRRLPSLLGRDQWMTRRLGESVRVMVSEGGRIGKWDTKGAFGQAFVLPKHKDLLRWRPISPTCSEPTRLACARVARCLNCLLFRLPVRLCFNLRAVDQVRARMEEMDRDLNHLPGLSDLVAGSFDVKDMFVTLPQDDILRAVDWLFARYIGAGYEGVNVARRGPQSFLSFGARRDDCIFLSFQIIRDMLVFDLRFTFVWSAKVLLRQVIGVPMGKSSSCSLACILCAWAEFNFLSTLGIHRRLVFGFRIIDDVNIFVAVVGTEGYAAAFWIFEKFQSCYGSKLRLERTDDCLGQWAFAGMMVQKEGTAVHTVALVKNSDPIWNKGKLVYGSYQDFGSYSTKRAKIGVIIVLLHRVYRWSADGFGRLQSFLAVRRELLM
ncbi:hypothetical protein CBR_g45952 [Chara braunii]|uniref:CCHC-type domain-containing protein n=1 Tax=Chara braunii TaxID=69332 RepID=A0A388LZR8_CHABU|nr:hypothetical protein CBR_g45952 [Chara braunii]|eukprot:GBG87796.1 hypothetical protein CBR_g45952 [Chara braunii]